MNQKSTNVDRLTGDRLPVGKTEVEFFVVFKNSAAMKGLSSETTSTEAAEADIRAHFAGEGDLADALMRKTVLYAIARSAPAATAEAVIEEAQPSKKKKKLAA